MSLVDATTLLIAWERARGQAPLERPLTLLAADDAERSVDEWAAVTIGERDRRLFDLRERLFGDCIEVTADCPRCGARLQAEFSTRDIEGRMTGSTSQDLAVEAHGYEVHLRLPTSRDLFDATDPGVADARALLVSRCVARVCQNGSTEDASSLPVAVLDTVLEAMSRADPLAGLEVGLGCASCGGEHPMLFDIAEHLWGDITECAKRTLREVHLLASAYHWAELDILRLTPTRRRMYLDMLGA
jgi:hypothetical protein